MKILLTAILVSACFLLSACGLVAMENARTDMAQSKNSYKNCLAQHPQDVSACNGAKLSYDADMRAYKATNNGLRNGTNDSINLNTSNED